MADWVALKAAGAEGKTVLVNLDAAYMVAPTSHGSVVSFLVSENGDNGAQAVSHVFTETPAEIMKKFKARANA